VSVSDGRRVGAQIPCIYCTVLISVPREEKRREEKRREEKRREDFRCQ